MTDDLRPPYRIAFDNARDPYAARNALGILTIAGSGGIAPANAQYVTAAANATLTAERVLTNTATITWDFATAGQAKANVAASYGDVFLSANNAFTGNNTFASSGRTSFGHTALVNAGNVDVHGSATTGAAYITAWVGADVGSKGTLVLQKSRGATTGTRGAVSVGDNVGGIVFAGDDGTVFRNAAQIVVGADAAFFGTGLPGRLIIQTASAAGALTERLRIDSAGLATFAGNTTSANYPAGAWTAWTPTLSASSGTMTTTTINTARYTRHGLATMLFLDVTITTAGTGAGTFNFTLPVACSSAGGGTFTGREIALSGNGLNSIVLPSATVATVAVYNGTTPIASGSRIIMSGVYEGV